MVDSNDVRKAPSELGLTGPFSPAEYVETMAVRFGRDATEFMSAVDTMLANGCDPAGWRRLYG